MSYCNKINMAVFQHMEEIILNDAFLIICTYVVNGLMEATSRRGD